jgi:hypothetical protein
MKKKEKIRWKKLHGEQMSVLRMSSPPIGDSNHFQDKEQFRTGGFSGSLLFKFLFVSIIVEKMTLSK